MLITGYAQQRNMDAATSILETMALRGVVPTVVSYNSLVSCLCGAGRASQAHNVVAMANRRGVKLDEWAWSAIIQVCGLPPGHAIASLLQAHGLGWSMSLSSPVSISD